MIQDRKEIFKPKPMITFVNMDERLDLPLPSTSYSSSNDNDILDDGFYWNDENIFDLERFLRLNRSCITVGFGFWALYLPG